MNKITKPQCDYPSLKPGWRLLKRGYKHKSTKALNFIKTCSERNYIKLKNFWKKWA